MMRLSSLLMAWAIAHPAELGYIDADKNKLMSYVIVDTCVVPVLKSKVHDTCYVVTRVNDVCKLDLNVEECRAKNK